MIDSAQLMQVLKSLQQKNMQGGGGISAPNIGMPDAGQQLNALGQKSGPSLFGYLGGLGDTNNAQGGVNPSFITQINKGISDGGIMGAGGGILKLLSSLFM